MYYIILYIYIYVKGCIKLLQLEVVQTVLESLKRHAATPSESPTAFPANSAGDVTGTIIIYMAIENGHRNHEYSHERWWILNHSYVSYWLVVEPTPLKI